MSGSFVIRGGTVCDELGARREDVVVRDGIVRAAGSAERGGRVLDATGCVVIPGLVDLHTHVREPGDPAVESIASAARAAAAGGYTCITVMPNTVPPIDRVELVEQVRRAAARACVDVRIAGCVTERMEGTALTAFESLAAAGVRYLVDETRGVPDDATMEEAIRRAERAGVLLGAYCLDESIAGDGVAHDGAVARSLGLAGIPPAAEESVVERSLALAEAHDARLHLLAVSTARSLELIRAAKRRGARVSAEIAPHHLLLSDEALRSGGALCKMKPPLRTEADRKAAVRALADGTVDVVVTDHAPHSRASKALAFEQASFGVIGLETALPWVMTGLELELGDLVERMSTRPARIGGYREHGGPIAPGRPANLCVVATDERRRVDVDAFASRSANSPIAGVWLTGCVRHTIAAGVPVYVDGAFDQQTFDIQEAS
ncbi:MAG TPA: dihydroorotase [Conexibacter sp.]